MGPYVRHILGYFCSIRSIRLWVTSGNTTISNTNCTLRPFSWTLCIMSLTSSAYAVAGSGWSALYLPLYTSGLGAWAGDKTLRWLLKQIHRPRLHPDSTARSTFLLKWRLKVSVFVLDYLKIAERLHVTLTIWTHSLILCLRSWIKYAKQTDLPHLWHVTLELGIPQAAIWNYTQNAQLHNSNELYQTSSAFQIK